MAAPSAPARRTAPPAPACPTPPKPRNLAFLLSENIPAGGIRRQPPTQHPTNAGHP